MIKKKKHLKIAALVNKIREQNVVVNMSQVELPDSVYIFLSKGLGFASTRKFDRQDFGHQPNGLVALLAAKNICLTNFCH